MEVGSIWWWVGLAMFGSLIVSVLTNAFNRTVEAELEEAYREIARDHEYQKLKRESDAAFRRAMDELEEHIRARRGEGARFRQTYQARAQAAPSFTRVLGLTLPVTEADVTKAYRKLALKAHPDRAGGSVAKMQELNSARDEAMRYLKIIDLK